MDKYEFIKETKLNGDVIYYTLKNGMYIPDSMSSYYDKAFQNYGIIKERGGMYPKVEVLDTVEMA